MKKIFITLLALGFIAIGCDTKQKTNKQSAPSTEITTDSVAVSNEAFSAVTLNKMFEDPSGNKISFQNILAKHKGAPIVIDVWASWCPDCIKGFPELKNLQQQYPNAAYVFLSLDKTKNKWTEAIKKYDLKGDHYYLNEKMKDEFGQSIQLDWIPRYIVVDAQGNIALKKAIVANDTLLINTLNKIQPSL
ncbi:TlpA family protein disulfide reductase [Flavobacterium sp. CBA20B-1]|uniref:TlpA family protein disulfide reductase n=1 Tax=unclassified Flavobacterium TaxID=196869 RepID=UPI00222438B1|nr:MULTISPECIES: TlpA disulfide reductase family protein [unclassified Flavobacterium]WCM42584.1 TlpA family protein disulfide reductase [Flavobacterium sp. CBA20B-1]